MDTVVEVQAHGAEAVPLAQPMWESLFDHHVSIGAAGLPTIPRELSWPRRREHYEKLFAEQSNAGLWMAALDDEPVGYAMGYEGAVDDERAMILETLSVLPSARGHGIGTRLMGSVDQLARRSGIRLGAVDVMGRNPRARDLYLRYGYAPYSEAWMRSAPAESTSPRHVSMAFLTSAAEQLGLNLSTSPGPDDTWESADDIVELTAPTSTTWLTSTVTARLSSDAPIVHGHEFARMEELFTLLTSSGLWTIRFEVPASSDVEELRGFLHSKGFQLSTERLVRTL